MKKIRKDKLDDSRELLKFKKIEIINLNTLNKIVGGNNIITTDDHSITDIISFIAQYSDKC